MQDSDLRVLENFDHALIEALDCLPNPLEGAEAVAVGDCNLPFNISEAIAAGHAAARAL